MTFLPTTDPAERLPTEAELRQMLKGLAPEGDLLLDAIKSAAYQRGHDKAVDRLLAWINHHFDCPARFGYPNVCSCGLAAILDAQADR